MQHIAEDDKSFKALRSALKSQNADVARRHEENKKLSEGVSKHIAEIKDQMMTVDSTISTFNTLLPDIKSGISSDQAAKYRMQMTKRVVLSIIGTLVTISTLIPLFSWIIGLKVALHFG